MADHEANSKSHEDTQNENSSRSRNDDASRPYQPGRVIPLADRSFTLYPWQIVAISVVSLVGGLFIAYLLFLLARPLALIFIAIVIAEALAPVVSRLERWIPRGVAVVGVYIVLLLVFVGIGWLVIPPLATQAQQVITDGPSLIEQARSWFRGWDVPGSDRIVSLAESRVDQLGTAFADLPLTVASAVIEIVLMFFLSLYWLLIVPTFRSFALSLVPDTRRDDAKQLFAEMGQMMGGYVRGAVLQGIIIGVLTYIGLLVIGIEFPLVLAVVAGVTELIPVIGPLIAVVPIVGIALLDGPTTALITLGFWIVIQQFENHVLTPNIMRSQTDLSPFLVLAAIFVGGQLAGFIGAVVAIPLAGVAKVIVVRLIAPWVRRWAGTTDSESVTRAGEPA